MVEATKMYERYDLGECGDGDVEEEVKGEETKQNHKKKSTILSINIQEAIGAEPLLRQVIGISQNRGFKTVIPASKATLRWVTSRMPDAHIIEWLNTQGTSKMINRYPQVSPLLSIDGFAILTKLARELDDQENKCF